MIKVLNRVMDPDPWNPYDFGPPGSESVGQRYGTGTLYHQEKIVRKTLFLLFCDFFMTFYVRKMM
jgi:hypothetical protein